MKNAIHGVLVLGFLAFGAACADDESSDPPKDTGEADPTWTAPPGCADQAAKYQSCGLLGEGTYNCVLPDGLLGDCITGCIVDAACEDLTAELCDPSGSPTIFECIRGCQTSPFACTDGTTVPYTTLCNGYNDCLDGADETGCRTFSCADGGEVTISHRCDGTPHCDDGSDEAKCPMFTCGNGDTIPASKECDLESDCVEGLDENAQCVRAICP